MMKKILFVFGLICLLGLSGCNTWRCEWTHPDDMSPSLKELCLAKASKPEVNQNVWK